MPAIRAIGQWILRCVPKPVVEKAQPITTWIQGRLEQYLRRCVEQPRRLQAVLIVVGLILAGLSWIMDFNPGVSQPAPFTTTQPVSSSDGAIIALPSTVEPLETIKAYNAASIVAGSTGKADMLQPFFVAGSPTWAEIEKEFKRRAGRLETHRASLSRWGIIAQQTEGDRATLDIQEQWSDETVLGDVVIDAQRGLLQRVTYHLERSGPSQLWLIKQIDSTSIIN